MGIGNASSHRFEVTKNLIEIAECEAIFASMFSWTKSN